MRIQQHKKRTAYLEVEDYLAESSPHEPSLRDIPDDGRWQTEEDHHKISHGEVHDEVVCDSPHAVISVHGHTDQRIAYQADQKNYSMKGNQNPLVRCRKYVILYHREIIIIRHTILIGAVVRRIVVIVKVWSQYRNVRNITGKT